jgi:hypothetical protein
MGHQEGAGVKHIVCFSGGHSSSLVAIEVVRKFGNKDVVLLNHDINESVEHSDIKRFKKQVADYLELPITFANMKNVESMDQFDVCEKHGGFLKGGGVRASMSAACTTILKTEPFHTWLEANVPDKDCIIYYGFDKNEPQRIQRRAQILGAQGYKSDYPLAFWNRTIESTKEIGIEPPLTYTVWKHANCQGCLKGGKQHWYVTYINRPDIFEKAKLTEESLGYSIIKGITMTELEPMFEKMKQLGIEASENIPSGKFWSEAKKVIRESDEDQKPCECFV